jgi:hypothetical protein
MVTLLVGSNALAISKFNIILYWGNRTDIWTISKKRNCYAISERISLSDFLSKRKIHSFVIWTSLWHRLMSESNWSNTVKVWINKITTSLQHMQQRIWLMRSPFRYGITIPLFRYCSDICPVTSVQNYIKFRNSKCIATESFFVTDEGLPLSRKFFISLNKATMKLFCKCGNKLSLSLS